MEITHGTSNPHPAGQPTGFIFDLDGVITQTARLHRRAWKRTFDRFLSERETNLGEKHRPFSVDDCRRFVDGKPRYEGVNSFLLSRGIELAFGDPNDEPNFGTVCGVGNTKNELFLSLVDEHGVDVFDDAVECLRDWRHRGYPLAVVTSSRNGGAVVRAAGLEALFDVRVDGQTAAAAKLRGKPEPDMFVEAARRLHVEPSKSVVFEDAIAGVEAGKRGGFGCVVGVERNGGQHSLEQAGADIVINDFKGAHHLEERLAPPSLWRHWEEVSARIEIQPVAVFLDFDGTLAPTVSEHDEAALLPGMQKVVWQLAMFCPVAVISGRDRKDVQERVGIAGILYAGSHGRDLSKADLEPAFPQMQEADVALAEAEKELTTALRVYPNARIERKRFSLAVHYRNCRKEDVPRLKDAVEDVLVAHPPLSRRTGKKVIELQADVDWDKGRAILKIMEMYRQESKNLLPIYAGDDDTDEDAFRALKGTGIGIKVGFDRIYSAADFAVEDPSDVKRFLSRLIKHLQTAPVGRSDR